MDNYTLQEMIDFFTDREGFDENELVADWIAEIPGLEQCYPDDCGVTNLEGEEITNLEDFSRAFYEKIMTGVCNVMGSFKIIE